MCTISDITVVVKSVAQNPAVLASYIEEIVMKHWLKDCFSYTAYVSGMAMI